MFMAIKLISNYAKRLGLPGYSSHQFSVSLESELTDLSQVQAEVARLYELLQDAVDREIQQSGYVPGQDSGGNSPESERERHTLPQREWQWPRPRQTPLPSLRREWQQWHLRPLGLFRQAEGTDPETGP